MTNNKTDNASIEFWVPGIPRPGGSKKGFCNARLKRVMIVKAGGQKEENWRQAVSFAAAEVMGENPPLAGPVRFDVLFLMPRPKSHYYTGKKRGGQLRDNAPIYHTKRPDRTKLVRSTEDAMRGIVWRDDSQVCHGLPLKLYGERPGARIWITDPETEDSGKTIDEALAEALKADAD